MPSLLLKNLHLFLWLSFAFLLPWQTKFIIKSSISNYWEIAIFISLPALLLALFLFFVLNKGKLSRPNNFYLFIIIGLLISGSFSLLKAPDFYLALFRYALLILFILTFYCLSQLPKDWRRYLLISFLVSLFLQALIGFWQFVFQLDFASVILGMAYHSPDKLGAAVIEITNGRWLRAYGASDHPNVFGGLMAIAALISAYFWGMNHRVSVRILFLSFFLVFFLALLTSFSRSAILAFSIGFILLIFEHKEIWKRYFFLLLMIVLLSASFYFQYSPLLDSRINLHSRLEQKSITERIYYNQRSLQTWQNNFWIGTGLANSTLFNKQEDQNINVYRPAWEYQPAHNYWLLIATEGGILFAIFLLLFWFLLYKKSRSHRLLSLFLLFFVLSLLDHWLFSLPLGLFWLAFFFATIR